MTNNKSNRKKKLKKSKKERLHLQWNHNPKWILISISLTKVKGTTKTSLQLQTPMKSLTKPTQYKEEVDQETKKYWIWMKMKISSTKISMIYYQILKEKIKSLKNKKPNPRPLINTVLEIRTTMMTILKSMNLIRVNPLRQPDQNNKLPLKRV